MQTRAAKIDPASHASKPFFGPGPAHATSFFASSPTVQTKLTVGTPGDRFEREADSVADAVVQRMESRPRGGSAVPSVQANCEKCEHEDTVQRQADGVSSSDTSAHTASSVQRGLAEQRGAGQSLDVSLRREMEQGIGADFSGVRIHTGASAAQLNDTLHARAFTHGQDVFFNAGEFKPHSSAGRHLLAHELTHVVQQSPQPGSVPSVQRDVPKPGSAADNLQKAKDELKAKFGLNISEQQGAVWTESRVRQLGDSLSKMSTVEQERLKGVTFVLTDRFPSKTLKGKPFTIAGKTTGTSRIELTPGGLGDTAIHEAGHLLHHSAIAQAEKLFANMQVKGDLDTARNFFNASKRVFTTPREYPNIMVQVKAVIDAANKLEQSGDDDRSANRNALLDAEAGIPYFTPDASTKDFSDYLAKLGAFTGALLRWSDEKEKVVTSVRRLDAFVSIVKKDKLDKRSSIIFTDYAEANWPDKPAEFFSEAYKAWRKSPLVVKRLSPDLVAWFESGGHLGPKLPPPRQPFKIQVPTRIQSLKGNPDAEELVLELGRQYLPAIEGWVNLGLFIPTGEAKDK